MNAHAQNTPGTRTTRVLLTGFEAFAGSSSNPSGEVVRRLISTPQPELADAGIELRGVILPVTFRGSGRALADAIDAHSPDLVIALGLAEGRTGITPERVAINLDDARIPDNDGDQPLDAPIDPNGPAAHFSGLPVKAIVAALTDAGIAASVSLTAGSYVCNHIAYLLGAHTARLGVTKSAAAGTDTGADDLTRAEGTVREAGWMRADGTVRAGFIHVPATPDLAPEGSAMATMTLDEIERGVRIAILTAAAVHDDSPLPGGAIH